MSLNVKRKTIFLIDYSYLRGIVRIEDILMVEASVNIGIIGLGTVGRGLLEIIKKSELPINIVAVVDRSYSKKEELLQDIAASDDVNLILKNKKIDTVIELVGGIDLPLYIARETIDAGKNFVTANKALLAEHGYSLFNKAHLMKTSIGFEAAIAGAIPIVRNLQEVFSFDKVHLLEGILNGTSNYILTSMRRDKKSYQEALAEAQSLGLAEADPTLDINGMDAAHKLAILSSMLCGQWLDVHQITLQGIDSINLADILWSEKMGYRIRLISRYLKQNDNFYLSVEPTMISASHFLYDIELEKNAVMIDTQFSDKHLFVGKGAGSLPTAFSVLSDIMQIVKNNGTLVPKEWQYGKVAAIDELDSPFYLRFDVKDISGVLAQIATVLGNNKISIASMQQAKDNSGKDSVDLVLVTHSCQRRNLLYALDKISQLEFIQSETVYLPIDK